MHSVGSRQSGKTSPLELIDDLDRLPFDNRFTAVLPADPEPENRRRQVREAAYSRVLPTAVSAPMTLAFSPEVADLLRLDPSLCATDDFTAVFSGNRIPEGADPFAACYGGHQFGNWAGQLGDGRAIALGEVVDRDGTHQTLQLKGPGPTPYSRTADGRAVLRSSVREFLCSEAMHHLGIPTTRALSLVATGDLVVRDMLYDGHPREEPGAIVCRVAPSFVRFGNFQLPAARDDHELLRALVEFTIRADFAHLLDGDRAVDDAIVAWFTEVCERTADLVLGWMRVGFVHGVLNTDNMSILGLTIDYGPYGWLEIFNPGWTPNTTDAGTARYRFGAQPAVGSWNLAQLASAIVPLVGTVEPLEAALAMYGHRYNTGFRSMMSARLGWGEATDDDAERVNALFDLMGRTETDYVLFFRSLRDVPVGPDHTDDDLLTPLTEAWYQPSDITGQLRTDLVAWLRMWSARVVEGGLDDDDRRARMNALNPRFVLRNWIAQEAIDAAEQGDASLLTELLDVLRRPYDEQPGRERFAQRMPEWARNRVGCSMLSCSS